MPIAQSLLGEWDHEIANTAKMLKAVPEAHAAWKPHPKSMSLGQLAAHIAEIPVWGSMTMNLSELDLNPPGGEKYAPTQFTSTAEAVALLESGAKAAREAIAAGSDEEYMKPWTLMSGGQAFFTMPKIAVMRSFVFNHLIHHRAQLSVYLRMHNVPVPGMYGPSADESM